MQYLHYKLLYHAAHIHTIDLYKFSGGAILNYKLDYKSIGERIKNRRKMMKLTQEQLANFADIGIQHLSKIENGKATLSLACFVAIANALQTTTDHLLMDNIIAATPNLLGEVKAIFDDCSHDELRIILKTASTLKDSIRQKKISD